MIKIRTRWKNVKIGSIFDRLEVIGYQFRRRFGNKRPYQAQWCVVCRCICGTYRLVRVHDLISNDTRSCGCRRVEIIRKTGFANKTHGMTHTSLYHVWNSMKMRCRNPNDTDFNNYGSRGINYTSAWENSSAFFEWALQNGYREGLQIDRKDNNGNYEPSNCHFVTSKRNGRNRRDTVYLTVWGECKPLIDWADNPRCMVSYKTLLQRHRHHWQPERAVSCPSLKQHR